MADVAGRFRAGWAPRLAPPLRMRRLPCKQVEHRLVRMLHGAEVILRIPEPSDLAASLDYTPIRNEVRINGN
jgi:hypothetical protein